MKDMYLTFLNNFINIYATETKSELIQALNKCNNGIILLGNDAQQENDYLIIKVYSGYKYLDILGIGVISEGHGIYPQTLLLPSSKKIIIGYNREITAVDCNNGKELFTFKLCSLFHSFIHLDDKILAIYEIGVIAFNENGMQLWKYENEIITNYEIEDNYLKIEFIDDEPICLNLCDGSKHI